MDHSKWRKLIKDVRWDGCEWVNVSSGTGLPRKSWTKGHLMVVCGMRVCKYISNVRN